MLGRGQQRDGEAPLQTTVSCLALLRVPHAAPTTVVSVYSPGVTADSLDSPSTCDSQKAEKAQRKVFGDAPGFTSLSLARLSFPLFM